MPRPAPRLLAPLASGLLALFTFVGGCARTQAISFATEIAPRAAASSAKRVKRDYDLATRAWTRHAMLSSNYQQVIEVYATLRSPQWMTASLERKFAIDRPNPPARQAALSEAQANAEQFVEVTLLVSTWDRAENILQRTKTSPWQVTMVDDAGNDISPISIERDKRPDFVIRAEFPAHGDFSAAYRVKFANTGQLNPERTSVVLRVHGVRGAVEMMWRNGETQSKYY